MIQAARRRPPRTEALDAAVSTSLRPHSQRKDDAHSRSSVQTGSSNDFGETKKVIALCAELGQLREDASTLSTIGSPVANGS